ncbi:hypothetical protein PFUGPA_02238 [Plasmodium falciparum Palo Alto/Uganda]|uniref:Plasmodium RESA N-terminal domain-containing protein n=1 Tax=Plasmodium falciparum (isolate Palo Alto / Uganda) TaxID=57270 RepID=W4J158_PLAFP|nr:hypothetical protein PFUGPA_02238 [Plasmodium falciparum Palo Alto/Uganda]
MKNVYFNRSLKFLCLTVCLILTIYSSRNEIHKNSLGFGKNDNIYSRNLAQLKLSNYSLLKDSKFESVTEQLTREELYELFDLLVQVPPRTYLLNIWNHKNGICRQGTKDLLKNLRGIAPKLTYRHTGNPNQYGKSPPKITWQGCSYDCNMMVSTLETEQTNRFYNLLNKKAPIDEIKSFIRSCIDEFDKLHTDLYVKYEKIFSEQK